MPGRPDQAPEIEATLEELGDRLVHDLTTLFDHDGVAAKVEGDRDLHLTVQGSEGHLAITWPPTDGLTEAEGRLGAHARIALELNLAAQTPREFWDNHRPVRDERQAHIFDRLRFYLEDSLAEGGYYDPILVEERGPALLVFCDDEYCLVSASGEHRGNGILQWKVKRLLAYALTDADEAFDR